MSRCRACAIWLLLFALPVLGFSGVVTGLLGSKHSHSASAAPNGLGASLEDVRRLSYRTPAAAPRHGHASWLRHHHAQAQADAVSLDAAGQDSAPADSTTAGASAVALATGCLPAFATRSVASAKGGWPCATASRVDQVAAQPLDRPPKS